MADAIKVLVVEDETVIGLDIVLSLREWGYVAEGPYTTSHAALAAIEDFAPDLAVLDLNLVGHDTSLPVARRLRDLGTPFLCLSGYSSGGETDYPELDGAPRLSKPVNDTTLQDALRALRGDAPA